ncbi:MAG: hypothetical protein HY231_23640 [Acidobacteria bacterium]|nr:hypothetical protein [Acidobacteriota bacterium]
MIYLGLNNEEKDQRIVNYCAAANLDKVFVLSPAKFRFGCSFANHEHIEWAEIILYKFFYRLLQEINSRTLLVINECLRTQNRYDLTYNCIRHFLNQTEHQLIFQYLPMIEEAEDFMILFDFDTRSRWKREKFNVELLAESQIQMKPVTISFHPYLIETDSETKGAYQKEKERLISTIGLKDPHTIPRNLYLMSGKTKLFHVGIDSLFGDESYYIGRNNRFKLSNLQIYKEMAYPHTPYTVFEFCHNFIDFADFLTLSGQTSLTVLTTDLKVDNWYLERYQKWTERLADVTTGLQQQERVGCGA